MDFSAVAELMRKDLMATGIKPDKYFLLPENDDSSYPACLAWCPNCVVYTTHAYYPFKLVCWNCHQITRTFTLDHSIHAGEKLR